jgi:hypothetical protein
MLSVAQAGTSAMLSIAMKTLGESNENPNSDIGRNLHGRRAHGRAFGPCTNKSALVQHRSGRGDELHLRDPVGL